MLVLKCPKCISMLLLVVWNDRVMTQQSGDCHYKVPTLLGSGYDLHHATLCCSPTNTNKHDGRLWDN